jgi:Trk K+ transport system NAD-binding subunit
MKPRIIVCGLGRTGYKIFCLLKQQGAAVVGVSDRALAETDDEEPNDIIIGDLRSRSTLIKAGVKEAQSLVLANSDDALNLAILTEARVLNPHIRIVSRLYNHTLGERLDATLPDHVSMSVSALAAPIFAFAAMGSQAIGQLQLYNQTWPIHEEVIDSFHPWLGARLSELWDNPKRMLIYYLPVEGDVNLVAAVNAGQRLQAGDRLIVGTQPKTRSRRGWGFPKLSKALTNWQQFHRHARPVALVTLALLVTIFVATLTYVFTNLDTSMVDALYFSVGMITGAGGQEQVAEEADKVIKVFTAMMMVIGAGVIGICYALINDFILGSRFKEFWDAARLPTRHHYIICGLGGIGMQIARHLHQQHYDVVVIERDRDNRFLHTARSLGIPVILEDASLDATLKAANIRHAEAVFAVTSNDMVNVEVALTAKAIKLSVPVIVRNQDPQLAHSVQKVFDFQHVLCPTELATPAFAAAALGGKILGNGMTGNLLWVSLATLITPNHPFCGKPVQTAAMDANFVPLYIETNRKTIHGWQLLKTCLTSGDILYLTMPATKLDLLWRVTPAPISLNTSYTNSR